MEKHSKTNKVWELVSTCLSHRAPQNYEYATELRDRTRDEMSGAAPNSAFFRAVRDGQSPDYPDHSGGSPETQSQHSGMAAAISQCPDIQCGILYMIKVPIAMDW